MDLATAALIALARKMPDDEWAQYQLNQMGMRPKKPPKGRKGKIGVSFVGEISYGEETVPVKLPKFPALSFEDLLKRALEKKKYDRVVIAIDDLDKQDPAQAHELLHNAQRLLKGGAWFMLTGHPAGLTRETLLRERGLFDLALKLEEFDQDTTYKMLARYLNSARPKDARYELDDPQIFHPFTPEAARALCERSAGVPRWLNRLARYVMHKAAELKAEIIDSEVLQQEFEYADKQLRGQPGLTAEDYIVLELVLERGLISDATVTLEDLERVKVKEFNEILPILEKLVQLDLLRRLPTERVAEYGPTPMLLGEHGKPKQEKPSEEERR